MSKRVYWIGLLVVIFAFGLNAGGWVRGEGGGSPGAADPDYFPLQSGNQWAFEVTSNGAKVQLEYRVTDRSEQDGQTMVTIESKVNNATQQTETYEVKPEGIFTVLRQVQNYQFTFEPNQCLLKYPVRVGGLWEQTGTFSDDAQNLTFTYKLKCKYEAIQNLKVPAGLFKVVKVSLVMDTSDGSHSEGYRYYSPGVGLVKEDFHMTFNKTTRTALLSVLKSYQVSK